MIGIFCCRWPLGDSLLFLFDRFLLCGLNLTVSFLHTKLLWRLELGIKSVKFLLLRVNFGLLVLILFLLFFQLFLELCILLFLLLQRLTISLFQFFQSNFIVLLLLLVDKIYILLGFEFVNKLLFSSHFFSMILLLKVKFVFQLFDVISQGLHFVLLILSLLFFLVFVNLLIHGPLVILFLRFKI